MKKLLAIFAITAVLSAIAFGISAAVFGVTGSTFKIPFISSAVPANTKISFTDGGASAEPQDMGNGTLTYEFTSGGITDIKFETISAKLNIVCEDVPHAKVTYTPAQPARYDLYASLGGGVLEVKEKAASNNNLFSFSGGSAQINVSLPRKEYERVTLSSASGDRVIDGLTAKRMTAETASGDDEMNIFANELDISSASGSLRLKNCTDQKAQKVSIKSASGDRVIDFSSDEWEISTASGDIKAYGLSGKVKLEMMSGDVILDYTEWNGDLKVNSASGDLTVALPAGSGADISFSGISGDLIAELSGQRAKLKKDESISGFGGSNIHRIDVETASGNVEITEKS